MPGLILGSFPPLPCAVSEVVFSPSSSSLPSSLLCPARTVSEVVFSPSSTSGPQQLALRLDPGQASLYVVASCCSYNYYPTSKVRSVIDNTLQQSIIVAAAILCGIPDHSHLPALVARLTR